MGLAALCLLVAKATLLLAAAGAAARALRRSGAAARHAVWTAGLAAALALPLAVRVLPAAPVPAHGRLWTRAAAWLNASPSPVGELDRPTTAATPRSGPDLSGEVEREPWTSVPPLAAIILAVWAAGAGVCLARLALSFARAAAIVRGARPVASATLSTIAHALAGAGLSPRSVRLLETPRVRAPACVGVLRPAVLLPSGWARWSADDARAVLAHELGHVARRDCLTQLVAGLATAAWWFHPLAWHAARRMQVERERACDDRALRAGVPPASYASLLVEMVRASRGPAPSAGWMSMAAGGEMESRVRAILDPAARPRALPAGLRVAGPFAAAAVAGLVAALQLEAAPRASSADARTTAERSETARGEPDLRGDSMALPSSERIPLPAGALAAAREAAAAALAGPDAAFARTLLGALGRAPARPGDLVRERAAWALSRASGTRLVEPLIAALSSRDWRERAYAAWALGESRDPRAAPALLAQLDRPEWRLRAMAAFALDELGDPRAAAAMARAAGDEAWQVRVSAVAYLGRLGGAENVAIVRAHLDDEHMVVRAAARDALSTDR